MSFRALFAGLLVASSVFAGPPLTLIQDVLYKADGTRFSGLVIISWNGFEARGGFAIPTQSTTVKIVDGNLRVRLVPSTTSNPPIYYSVVYNSEGRVQFSETWAVPPTDQPLHLNDVRVPSPDKPPPCDPGTGWPPQTLSNVTWSELEATLWAQLTGTTWQ